MRIELESVGYVIDTETLRVHSQFFGGGYDKENSVHITKCEDDFFLNISEQDVDLIKDKIKYNIVKRINKIKDHEKEGEGDNP